MSNSADHWHFMTNIFLEISLFQFYALALKQTLGISTLPWQNFGQSPPHLYSYSPPSPGAGGGAVVTNDSCIRILEKKVLQPRSDPLE